MSELGDALRAFGLVLTTEDVDAARLAAGGGDTFNFEQFIEAIKKTKGRPEFSNAALQVAFLQFDRKGNGFITEKDIRYILTNKLVEPLSEADANTFMAAASKKVTKESNNYNYADLIDIIEQLPSF